jgi:tRNA threonylcarbamoyladenosine biosynthesis protein TsaB
MIILAIETATEACSVALLTPGALLEDHRILPRGHTEHLLPMIDGLLASAGLATSAIDAIAFGRGPGAFTGVRIGVSVAQGLGYALDRPLIPVSTLATLAQGAVNTTAPRPIFAAIDARMGEIYCGRFSLADNGLVTPLAEERVTRAADLPPLSGEWYGIGSGWQSWAPVISGKMTQPPLAIHADALPRAADCARLAAHALSQGSAIPAHAATPTYLRDQVAQPRTT